MKLFPALFVTFDSRIFSKPAATCRLEISFVPLFNVRSSLETSSLPIECARDREFGHRGNVLLLALF